MGLLLGVSGSEVQDERIGVATRELLREVRADADPQARLITEKASPGSKGDVVSIGQIALALATGGAVGKLIECVFTFLGRNKKLQIEITNESGAKLTVNAEYVNRYGTDQATKLAEEFLAKRN
ncbi:hypothetical protein M2175_001757 [Bradyrhizobium elkanii]|uniref:effector-associated constant component EACC1 n=1 Tax=Bradyrhizobium TaxID=374 RepID=UPI0021694D61|nr:MULTISPECIES: hypothetical protein [Bradyrhizobium]MCS3926726.1 hypothetical protein [Bradyrhizobium elkanii]MCS3967279.1 hypothetical protein [Bradyrhizobium japonicum]